MPKIELSLPAELMEDDEYRLAYTYMLRRMSGEKVVDIAKDIKMPKTNLYRRIKKWKKSGLWDRVRRDILSPQIEQIAAAQYRVLKRYPEILDGIADIALNARSPQWRLEAAKWLYDTVVQPSIENAESTQQIKEIQYVAAQRIRFDPTSIPASTIAGKQLGDIIDGKIVDENGSEENGEA